MASTFKNAKLALTTGGGTIYTVPAATTSIVLMAQCANIDGTNNTDVSLSWTDDSNSDTETYLAKTVVVPADAALGLLDGKLVLEAGDTLKGYASADSDLVLTVSVLELT